MFPNAEYSIVGQETCPDTDRLHFQCYAVYPNARTWASVKTEFAPHHVEVAKGSAKQNIKYCSKEDPNPIITGTEPHQGSRTDIADFVGAIVSGATDHALLSEYPSSFLRYGRHVTNVRNAAIPTGSSYDPTIRVIVYWGPSGSGKTRSAYTHEAVFPLFSCKPFWFDGFTPGLHKTLLIDDFRPDDLYISKYLQLTDKYRRPWPVKGGIIRGTWSTIVITADSHPREWYKTELDPNVSRQVLRRIDKIVHLTLDQSIIILD